MIAKSGAWGAASAWGATGMALLAFASWQFFGPRAARAPKGLEPASLIEQAPKSAEPVTPLAALPEQAVSPAQSAPAAAPKPASPTGPIAPKNTRASASPAAPEVDIARVLPSGEVVVAGRTEPGAVVTLLDNGKPVMDMRADTATGEFVFLPSRLPPGPHELSLRGAAESGKSSESAVMAFTIAQPTAKAASDIAKAARVAQEIARAAQAPAHGAQQIAAASTTTVALQPREKFESPVPKSNMATIARGDTLWRLSRSRLGRGALYQSIFQANSDKIHNPDLIYPGQALTIP